MFNLKDYGTLVTLSVDAQQTGAGRRIPTTVCVRTAHGQNRAANGLTGLDGIGVSWPSRCPILLSGVLRKPVCQGHSDRWPEAGILHPQLGPRPHPWRVLQSGCELGERTDA